jgi:ketosteroid isomerase-like protein
MTPAGDRAATTDHRAATAPAADSPGAAVRDTTDINAALADWLDATKRGDIDRQMSFYPPRVPVYYTWRDVPRDAVRDEKRKVFGAATRLDITTDTPSIEVSDNGRSALARFRKRYVIEGPTTKRRGEVVQELRWSRMPDGWRIVAERDAEVLAP